jgi:DNA polymerase III epsilon subunit-like protein
MNNIIEFLKSVTVLDTETTDMNATVCEIVEVGSALYENYWTSANLLLGSNNPIAFKASAKNNISRKMIAG